MKRFQKAFQLLASVDPRLPEKATWLAAKVDLVICEAAEHCSWTKHEAMASILGLVLVRSIDREGTNAIHDLVDSLAAALASRGRQKAAKGSN